MTNKLIRAGVATLAAVMFANAALAANAALTTPEVDKISPNARQFLDIVRTNFRAWDADHTGRLTRAEIEIDMQDPMIKGDAAAALAALKWGATDENAKEPKSYSLADFDEMEKTLAAGKTLDKPYLSYFSEGQLKLKGEKRQLFSDAVPHLVAIRQNLDSDCYFNSAVGSVALASPQTIMKLIQQNADGSFTVTFPGKVAEQVSPPTDAEIAAYTDASDGVWFNVLEKAYARIRPIKPEQATEEPMDAAALIPGDQNGVMSLVSGHQTRVTLFPLISKKPADTRFLQAVRADLASAFHDHRAVVTDKYHHAYAVVAYDPRTDTVTIHNPYDGNGGEGMPDGQNGLSSAGFFSMSTEKFVENFKSMGVEQTALN
jgi:hypothetical protein